MNKDKARLSVTGAISMALKDPTLQQGFEIICKNLAELEKENAELEAKYESVSIISHNRGQIALSAMRENREYDTKLTNAKEIIKGLLSFVDSLGNFSGGIFAKAEQFLKEVEK